MPFKLPQAFSLDFYELKFKIYFNHFFTPIIKSDSIPFSWVVNHNINLVVKVLYDILSDIVVQYAIVGLLYLFLTQSMHKKTAPRN